MASTQTDRIDGVNSSMAIKVPVIAASAGAPVDIVTGGNQTVDGIAITPGMRVLVKDGSAANPGASSIDNGIYLCSAGPWRRDVDADGNRDLTTGTLVLILAGDSNAGFVAQLISPGPIKVGLTPMTWVLLFSALNASIGMMTIGTISAMRAVSPPTTGAGLVLLTGGSDLLTGGSDLLTESGTIAPGNAALYVFGAAARDDGGAGAYYWDSTSVAIDDGYNVVAANGVSSGRWIRATPGGNGMATITATGAVAVDNWLRTLVWNPAAPALATFTLPPNPGNGERHTIKNRLASSAYPLNIMPNAGQAIDDEPYWTLANFNDAVTIEWSAAASMWMVV